MQIVVMTNEGSVFGKKLLNALAAHRIAVDVLVIQQPLRYHLGLFRSVRRRVGWRDAIWFSARHVLRPERVPARWNDRPFESAYERLAARVVTVEGSNTPETVSALGLLKPDLLLLGQTGIVRTHILSVPSIGTLNSHPGILPDYRGIDCPLWALWNGEPDNVGVTVHWVDKGVDTGPIVLQRRVSITPDIAPSTIGPHVYDHAVEALCEVVAGMRDGQVPAGTPQVGGRQYYKMPRAYERALERRWSKARAGAH